MYLSPFDNNDSIYNQIRNNIRAKALGKRAAPASGASEQVQQIAAEIGGPPTEGTTILGPTSTPSAIGEYASPHMISLESVDYGDKAAPAKEVGFVQSATEAVSGIGQSVKDAVMSPFGAQTNVQAEAAIKAATPTGMFDTVSGGKFTAGKIGQSALALMDPTPFNAITSMMSGKLVAMPGGKQSFMPSGILGKIGEMNVNAQYNIADQVKAGVPGYHQFYAGETIVGITPGPFGKGFTITGNFQGTPEQAISMYAAGVVGVDPRSVDLSQDPNSPQFGTKLTGWTQGLGGVAKDGMLVSAMGAVDNPNQVNFAAHIGLVNDLMGVDTAMKAVSAANLDNAVKSSMMDSLAKGELHAEAMTDAQGNTVGYSTATGGFVTDSSGNVVTDASGNGVGWGTGGLKVSDYNQLAQSIGTPGVDAGPYGGFDAGTGIGDMSAGTIGEWTNFDTADFESIGVTGIDAGTGVGDMSAGSQGEWDNFMSADFESIGVTGIDNSSTGESSGHAAGSQGEFDAFDTADFDSIGADGIGGDSGGGDSGGDGGCYITTATLNNTDEPDDGETLTTFRNFRDTYMMETPERRAKLKSYYENAPKVVDALDAYSGKDKVYQTMYDKFLKPAQYLIKQGANDKAEQVYDNMVNYAASNVRIAMAEGGAAEKPAVLNNSEQTETAGFVDRPPEQVSEAESVADNVPADVEEGTFVLNAPAVEFMGSEDVKKMLVEATDEAERQGVDIVQNNTKMDKKKLLSLVVSKGEVIIPPVLAKIIGYDRLEKINNRGKQEVERRIAENGQDIPPEAQQTASDGGTQNSVADTEVIDVYRSIVAQGGDPGRFQVFEKAFQEYQKGKVYRPMQSEIGTPEFDEEVRRKYGYAFPETEGGVFATEHRDAPLAKTNKKVSNPDSGEGFVPAP